MIKLFASVDAARAEADRHFAGIIDVNGTAVPFGRQPPRTGAAVMRGVRAVDGGWIVTRRARRITQDGLTDAVYALTDDGGWESVPADGPYTLKGN